MYHDFHNHLSVYASMQGCCDLSAVYTYDNACRIIKTLPDEKVSIVKGWNSSRFKFDEKDLQSFPPVLVANFSLHGFVLSSAAETLLKDEFPEIVENWRNSSWCEDHLSELLCFYSYIEPMDRIKLDSFFTMLESKKIFSLDDMLLSGDDVINAVNDFGYAGRVRFFATPEIFKDLSPQGEKTVIGIKLFTDGALGAKTAALKSHFSDGVNGFLLHSDEEVEDDCLFAFYEKKGVAIHAIGELAVNQCVRVYDKLVSRGKKLPFFRIEHAQFIEKEDALHAKKLNMILSMQPNFNSDSVWYRDRLDDSQILKNNPFRMLIDEIGFKPGIDMIFGSDGMPHGIDEAFKWCSKSEISSQKLSEDEIIKGYVR